MRGRNQLEAASGTMPRWENTKPKRAASLAIRTSIGSSMVTPMPTAGPFTAAITGFREMEDPRRDGSPAVARRIVREVRLAVRPVRHRCTVLARLTIKCAAARREIRAGAERAARAG